MNQSQSERAGPADMTDSDTSYGQVFTHRYTQSSPQSRRISATLRNRYANQYGRIYTYFKTHPNHFEGLQRWLKQARIGTTYDRFLMKSVQYTVLAAIGGVIFGILLTALLSATGVLSSLTLPFGITLPDILVPFVTANRVFVLGFVIASACSVVGSIVTWFGRYYYPRVIADKRQRNINILLPHAVVYLFALSRGGMGAFEAIKTTAKADEIYGEVSNELDLIVRDVEYFGNDLMLAIQNTRDLTPSDNLTQFLDDVFNTLDSGSDFTAFLERESHTYRRKAREEQEDFLETLVLLSEIFIVGFVAAPLLLITTLLIISLVGGDTLLPTILVVYVGLPLGMLAFIVLIKHLSTPFADTAEEIPIPRRQGPSTKQNRGADNPDFELYHSHKRRQNLRQVILNPSDWILNHDALWSITITAPLAGLGVLVLLMNGHIPSSWSGAADVPIRATTGFVLLPFFIMGFPVAGIYEFQTRRKRQIETRFPDLLNMMSSMNKMNIRFSRTLEMISTEIEGQLSDEIKKVRNDIRWTHDVEQSLLSFANRLRVPQITRTMKLLSAGRHSSGDLSKILDIAAKDSRFRVQTERKRRREISAYVVIVIVGFLVFVGVFLVVDQSYLSRAAQISSEASSDLPGDLSVETTVPTAMYRTLLFHATLIQGIGSGLLAGELTDGNVLSGLKYCLLLVSIATIAFTVV